MANVYSWTSNAMANSTREEECSEEFDDFDGTDVGSGVGFFVDFGDGVSAGVGVVLVLVMVLMLVLVLVLVLVWFLVRLYFFHCSY